MTKDSGLQIHSNRSKRSCIGLVVDGTNAIAATETSTIGLGDIKFAAK